MKAATSPLLDVRSVDCTLGGQPILSNLSLRIEAGERVAVIGPNGAGKSTLFQVIGGLLPVQKGSVWLGGRRIDQLPPSQIARAGVGRSFQSPQVFGSLSVADNLRSVLIAGERPRRWWRQRADDELIESDLQHWLGALDLQACANVAARQIDYAHLRALELGLGLLGRAPLLLLDEPTAGMSHAQAAHMLDLIERVCGDRTLLLIEHDPEAVFRLASRVVALHQGQVLADGTPTQIRHDARVQAVYLGTAA